MAKNKNLDTELSLIAFISLLSVLICSLLLTAIWIQIGSINVKQAVGGQAQSDSQKIPSVWVKMVAEGELQFNLQDAPKAAHKLNRKSIKGLNGKIDVNALKEFIEELKGKIPDIRTALIQPQSDTVYEDIIVLMDNFKETGLIDLGVSPL